MSFTSGPFAPVSQRILRDQESGRPTNTKIAYKSCITEYFAFFNSVFGGENRYPGLAAIPDGIPLVTVTEEKLFAFLFYHTYRQRKRRGRKRKEEDEQEDDNQ